MKHFLNGIEVAPRNILTIGVESDFTDRPEYLEVDTDRLILPREAVAIIQSHLATYGPFEGIPYTMITNGGDTLEYYVDLQEETLFRDFEIEVKIKKRGGKDNFFDRADGTSFELMKLKGVNFDVFDIPYILVQDNAVMIALTLGVTIYVLAKEVIQQTIDISTGITNIIDAVTPQTGVGVTFSIGQIATMIIKVIVQIAILALVLIALIKMIEQFFELIFPKVRNFLGCKVKRLLEQSCNYLGYQFESTLLDGISGLTILPVPLVKEKESFWDTIANDLNFAYTKGYPTASDSTPMLGQLLTELEGQFNARTTVRDGVVHFEIRNYFLQVKAGSQLSYTRMSV